MSAQFVFGYGSLAAWAGAACGSGAAGAGPPAFPGAFLARLRGHRRAWGVAMDNRVDLLGYKYYTDPAGRRPPVFVAYLDLLADGDPTTVVNGLCLPVDDARLRALDTRERNYERVDVSAAITWEPAGPAERPDAPGAPRIWAYRGHAEARRRLVEGRRAGRAVIDAAYLRAVERGFAALGAAEHAACLPSLAADGLPVVELHRHELGGGLPGRRHRAAALVSRRDPTSAAE